VSRERIGLRAADERAGHRLDLDAQRRAAAYSCRNIASASAMSAISFGSTLSFGAWIDDSGSSTPIRVISAWGYVRARTLQSGMEPP
jgi:hypothetical protein